MSNDASSDATRVIVTGATSGLGREMVRQLAARGWRVAFTGRREAMLEETRAIAAAESDAAELLPLRGSVTDMADVRAHHAAVVDAWGGVDWLILNAGVSDTASAFELTAEHIRFLYEVNIFGVANWLEVALPGMIAADSGVIVGMSSLAGARGFPTSAGYASCKRALITLLESLRVDLYRTGVDIVTVAPGYIKSEITARNVGKMAFLLETDDGVRRILRGVDRRQSLVTFPWQMSWFLRFVAAPMPNWLYDRIASKIKRKKKKYVDPNEPSQAAPPPPEKEDA